MGACAEGKFGINLDLNLALNLRQMTSVMYHNRWRILFRRNNNRFEAFLLPLFIPVAIFSLAYIIFNRGALERKLLDTLAQRIFIKSDC
jgi:hypothetical protein